MMGYSVHGEIFNPEDLIVENILRDMWKYNQTFSIASGVCAISLFLVFIFKCIIIYFNMCIWSF